MQTNFGYAWCANKNIFSFSYIFTSSNLWTLKYIHISLFCLYIFVSFIPSFSLVAGSWSIAFIQIQGLQDTLLDYFPTYYISDRFLSFFYREAS